jgi:hypothetical protein
MVQRVIYRRRHCYATKSNKIRKVKTPGTFCFEKKERASSGVSGGGLRRMAVQAAVRRVHTLARCRLWRTSP